MDESNVSLDDTSVHYVDCAETALGMMRWLGTTSKLAIDTETTGLERSATVRIAQIADGQQAWVIPIELPGSWGGLLQEVLTKFEGEFIFHNAPFDLRCLENTLGRLPTLQPHRVHDTMFQARVLEPTKSAALKRLSTRHVDSRAAIMQGQLDEALSGGGHTWATVPLTFEPYWFYAGIDAILTWRVDEILRPSLGPAYAAYELERYTIHVTRKMEQHGAFIDRETTQSNYTQLMEYVKTCGDWCQESYGVGAGKNLEVIAFLEAQGYAFDKTTKLGAKALDRDVLESIDHPLAQVVLRRRQAQKICSTYLRHFLEDVDEGGRLHPSINSCQAKTSRMSMSEPNLQNLPRKQGDNPVGYLARYCIVPAEGYTLLMCDFDQVEFRIFSSLAPGDELVRAFDSDDVFSEMSRQLYHDDTITKADPRRQTTKSSVYTRLFGGGDEKFALVTGLPIADAKQFTGLMNLRFPGLRQLQQQIISEGRARHQAEGEAYVRSNLTQRPFIIDDASYYKLVNYKIQGMAAEVLKYKLLELDAAGLTEFLVCPVHDEVIAEAPDDMVREVAMKMHEVMNDDQLFRVPITASVSHGQSWGAKEDYAL